MNSQQNPEEIDILQFFNAIGKFFLSIIRGLKDILNQFFYLVLDAILFLKKNIIFLVAGSLLGFAFSFLNSEKTIALYTGEAIVRTNFDSQMELQEQLDILNDLIETGQYEQLASILNIKKDEAKSLLSFDMSPIINDLLLIDAYDGFIKSKDTMVQKYLEFDDFKRSVKKDPTLSIYWKVIVDASNPDVFKYLNSSLKNLLSTNKNLVDRKDSYLFALKTDKEKTLQSLADIDSMRNIFNKVLFETAKKESVGGTNVFVGSEQSLIPEKPYNLFDERDLALKRLEIVTKKLNKYSDVLVMIDNLPEYGVKNNKIMRNNHFLYAAFGFILVLIFLALKDFNIYLKKYQLRKEAKEV